VIVLSGSPLFNGGAGSGESEIRRYLLEHDFVEAIIALPTEIFFRTGIGTYLWVLSNKKPAHRKDKVQLIDATNHFIAMRKNEGNKRKQIGPDQIREIVEMYSAFEATKESRIFDYREFGYRRIKVLRPLRMALHLNQEGLDRLKDEKAWGKLTDAQQAAWENVISPLFGRTCAYGWAEDFCSAAPQMDAAIGKVAKAFIKAFINAFGERDPEGDIVLDKDGDPVPDDQLTDYENVPLNAGHP
jgi:type I restriction enzyme M protein